MKIKYEKHPVSAERKKELREAGYKIIDARFAPKDETVDEEQDGSDMGLGTDSGDQFSNEQLRAAIKDMTGESPAGRTSRENLIKQFNELNAEAA